MPEWTNPKDPPPPAAPKPLASWYAQGLSDGLGDRLLMFDNSSAPSLELLRLNPALADIPGFEAALREQVRRLDGFRHPAFARIRAVQRLEPDDDLALISNCTPGKRLSEVLHRARGAAFAAAVIEQLGPALLLFQQHDRGVAHGALSPDRIIVSPDGQFTIVEHVVGPAIDVIGLPPARLRSMGIALPATAGEASVRLDVATDWYQLGLVAMSALLGRQLTSTDLPQLERLLDGLSQAPARDGTVLSPWIRQWLDRALQISSSRIDSTTDARAAIEEVLDRQHHGAPRRIRSSHESDTAAAGSFNDADVPPLFVDLDRSPGPAAAPAPPVELSSVEIETPALSAPPVTFSSVTEAPAPSPAPAPPLSTAPSPPPQPPTPKDYESVPALTEFGSELDPLPSPSSPRPEPVAAKAPPRPAPARKQASPANAVRRPLAVREARPAAQPRVQAKPTPPAPAVQVVQRQGYSTAVVAALMLLVFVQAGVIALMARALWFETPPAIEVKKDAAGGNVLVSSKPAESTPLRLAAAPDLSWITVTSPSIAGLAGAKAATLRTGNIKVASPITLTVLENSRQIGSVPGAELKVTPGKHDIELVNTALGYRLKQSVEIEAGQTVTIHVAPAQGWATIYAVPTAEVSIDGRPVGRTPLGPLPLALGEHTVTFTHSTGATDRQRIKVSSGETIRVIGNPRR
jgi:hypothetical protein